MMIDTWPVGIRAYYARITERMCTFGPTLGMPFTESLGKGLFEIRARGKEGIGRAFFCTVTNRKIVILHAYIQDLRNSRRLSLSKPTSASSVCVSPDIKKSQKIPARELEVARKRLAEVQREDQK